MSPGQLESNLDSPRKQPLKTLTEIAPVVAKCNTSQAAQGVFAHHLQRRNACYTLPSAKSKMADRIWK